MSGIWGSMKKNKIIHIVYNDKFIAPFIDFLKEYDLENHHTFIYYGGVREDHIPFKKGENIKILGSNAGKIKKLLYSVKYLYFANKIILHSLLNPYLIRLLYIQPWLLKKCYWVIWGADLYSYMYKQDSSNYLKKEKYRKRVVSKMGHFITYIKGDYELAQKCYGATGKYHECFMYPSNLYKEYSLKENIHKTINIQVGNSADPTNNHFEIFEKLRKYQNEDIKIFVPLSYGNQEYAKKVIAKGDGIFGENFHPMTEFMEFDTYLEFLGEIDIAIFAHKRQQAMGNTITLLGLGKKVYMRSDVTPWRLFKDVDVKVFDVKNIEIDLIDKQTQQENKEKIKEYFSQKNYLKQLQNLFESK